MLRGKRSVEFKLNRARRPRVYPPNRNIIVCAGCEVVNCDDDGGEGGAQLGRRHVDGSMSGTNSQHGGPGAGGVFRQRVRGANQSPLNCFYCTLQFDCRSANSAAFITSPPPATKDKRKGVAHEECWRGYFPPYSGREPKLD